MGRGKGGEETYGTDICELGELEDIFDRGLGGVGGGWAVECWGGHGWSIGRGHVRWKTWKV